jgi:hypothetical protein
MTHATAPKGKGEELMSATSYSILAVAGFVAFLCVAALIYFLTRDKNR